MDLQPDPVRLSQPSSLLPRDTSQKTREMLVLKAGVIIFAPAVILLCLSAHLPSMAKPDPAVEIEADATFVTAGPIPESVLTSFTVPD